jgi:hypothetical protein
VIDPKLLTYAERLQYEGFVHRQKNLPTKPMRLWLSVTGKPSAPFSQSGNYSGKVQF